MKSLVKRSMRIAMHRTSVALEPAFWEALETLAHERRMSLPAFMAVIDKERELLRPDATLASAARVYVIVSGKPKA